MPLRIRSGRPSLSCNRMTKNQRSHGGYFRRNLADRALAGRLMAPHIRETHKRGGVPLTAIETIREDFASLDDWEDRYRYVIELGHTLEPLSESAHNSVNKVRGCVSQVWLECEARRSADGEMILHYRGDSDSHLVRGLIAIAIALFSDQAPGQILVSRRLWRLSRPRPRAASDAAAIERRSRHGRAHSR